MNKKPKLGRTWVKFFFKQLKQVGKKVYRGVPPSAFNHRTEDDPKMQPGRAIRYIFADLKGPQKDVAAIPHAICHLVN